MKLIIVFLLPLVLYANECITCHPKKMEQCKNSNHFTMKNEINITRFAWGTKDSNVTLQTLPLPKDNIHKPADLVDDFLRRKCLQCHLTSKEINSTQNLCLACHNPHVNKQDSFKAKPTQQKCLKCHNNNYIGTDYLGLFPHDYDKAYRSPITKEGNYPKRPYGIDFHHLTPDIHHQKGLSCIDCHKNDKGKKWEETVNCKSCHSDISKQNHQEYHTNISCSACHSSWNISNYELNVLRDDTKNYNQWKRLTIQEDKYLEKFLKKALKNPKIKPQMPDYLTNKLEDGVWYSGWKFKRWENFFLVNDENGKIKIAIPRYQYRISFKNEKGEMIFDDISQIDDKKLEAFIPTSPHTVTKKAKSCEMCHENKIMTDSNLINKKLFQGTILKGSPLSQKQLKKLNSPYYKQQRATILFAPK